MLIPLAYGDGLASEILPPEMIGSKNVTLSINSSPFLIDNTHVGTQINFVLIDAGTQQPFPDVTLSVSAFKGNNALFGHIFKSDSGNFLINIIPQQSGSVTFEEKGGFLSGMIGQNSGSYDVKGPIFNSGGLYRFKLEVLTMGSYSNQVSKPYNAAISIPETNQFQVYDNEYGKQNVTLIAYYDQINNFNYDANKKTINFSMPFDWSDANLRQVTVVHQEIKIPKSFGDFIVTKYNGYVNGVKLDDKAMSIDDYSSDDIRIVHLILYKQELAYIKNQTQNTSQQMNYSLSPASEDNFPIVQFTRNAQYKVSLSWDPPKILPGNTTKFSFKVLDPYLVNKTVNSLDYDFTVIEGSSNVIYHNTGKTTSDGSLTTVVVPFPSNYTGPITIGFENLNGNSFADSEFSAIVAKSVSVPEFPAFSVLTLLGVLGFAILLTRIGILKNNKYS
jgi:hypothetical protein